MRKCSLSAREGRPAINGYGGQSRADETEYDFPVFVGGVYDPANCSRRTRRSPRRVQPSLRPSAEFEFCVSSDDVSVDVAVTVVMLLSRHFATDARSNHDGVLDLERRSTRDIGCSCGRFSRLVILTSCCHYEFLRYRVLECDRAFSNNSSLVFFRMHPMSMRYPSTVRTLPSRSFYSMGPFPCWGASPDSMPKAENNEEYLACNSRVIVPSSSEVFLRFHQIECGTGFGFQNGLDAILGGMSRNP